MESINESQEEIMKKYEILTMDQKCAIKWVISNMQIIKQLMKGGKIPSETIEGLIEQSFINEDYIMLALLLYKKQIDKNK